MPGIVQQSMQQANPKDVQRVVIAAAKILHDPSISQQLVQMMKQAGDPVQGIAAVLMLVCKEIAARAKGMPPTLIQGAAAPILKEILALAQAAGIQVGPQTAQQVIQLLQQQMQGAQAAPGAQPPAAPAGQPQQPAPVGG